MAMNYVWERKAVYSWELFTSFRHLEQETQVCVCGTSFHVNKVLCASTDNHETFHAKLLKMIDRLYEMLVKLTLS